MLAITEGGAMILNIGDRVQNGSGEFGEVIQSDNRMVKVMFANGVEGWFNREDDSRLALVHEAPPVHLFDVTIGTHGHSDGSAHFDVKVIGRYGSYRDQIITHGKDFPTLDGALEWTRGAVDAFMDGVGA